MRVIARWIVLGAACVAGHQTQAADLAKFELEGLRLGMPADQVEKIVREHASKVSKLPTFSFAQSVARAKGEQQAAGAPAGVQTIHFEGSQRKCSILFAQMAAGSLMQQLSCSYFGSQQSADLKREWMKQLGEPDKRDDRAWVWGDTAFLYSRTRAYFELNPNPPSAFPPRPIIAVVLADPAIQKSAQQAIQAATARN